MWAELWASLSGRRQPKEKGGPVDDYLVATGMISRGDLEEIRILQALLTSAGEEFEAEIDNAGKGRGIFSWMFPGRTARAKDAVLVLAGRVDAAVDLTDGHKTKTGKDGQEINVNLEKLVDRLPGLLARHRDFLVDHAGASLEVHEIAMSAGIVDRVPHVAREKTEHLMVVRAFQQLENLRLGLEKPGIFGGPKGPGLAALTDENAVAAERALFEKGDGLTKKYLGAYVLLAERLRQVGVDALTPEQKEEACHLIHSLQLDAYHNDIKDQFGLKYLVSSPREWADEQVTSGELLKSRLKKTAEEVIKHHAKARYGEEPFKGNLEKLVRTPDVTPLVAVEGDVTYENIAKAMRDMTLADSTLSKEMDRFADLASPLGVTLDMDKLLTEAAVEVVKGHKLLTEDVVLGLSNKLEAARAAAVRQSPVGGMHLPGDGLIQAMTGASPGTATAKE